MPEPRERANVQDDKRHSQVLAERGGEGRCFRQIWRQRPQPVKCVAHAGVESEGGRVFCACYGRWRRCVGDIYNCRKTLGRAACLFVISSGSRDTYCRSEFNAQRTIPNVPRPRSGVPLPGRMRTTMMSERLRREFGN